MPPTMGAAIRLAPNGNAAPTANRDGADHRKTEKPLGSASTTDRYEARPASSTGKKPGQRKDVHRLVRLWRQQLTRLKEKRYGGGPLPDDDVGRRFAAIMVDVLLQGGPDGHREAAAFAEQSCPWMTSAEFDDIFAQKRTFWTPAAIGDALGLTRKEQGDCRITAIRPAGATDADMAADRRMKNTAAKREARKQEAPRSKKQPLPSIRAKIISEKLKPGQRRTVNDVCTAVKKLSRFRPKTGSGLKAAVHAAIEFGVAHGMFLKQVEPGPRGPVAWIVKLDPMEQGRGSGCGQEFPTVGKTCPQVRVLIIEEALPVGEAAAEPAVEDDDWFTGEWEQDGSDPDGGRVAQAPPSAGNSVIEKKEIGPDCCYRGRS